MAYAKLKKDQVAVGETDTHEPYIAPIEYSCGRLWLPNKHPQVDAVSWILSNNVQIATIKQYGSCQST